MTDSVSVSCVQLTAIRISAEPYFWLVEINVNTDGPKNDWLSDIGLFTIAKKIITIWNCCRSFHFDFWNWKIKSMAKGIQGERNQRGIKLVSSVKIHSRLQVFSSKATDSFRKSRIEYVQCEILKVRRTNLI